MYTKWTSHLTDPDDKFKFENSIIGSKPVLERIRDLLQEEENALDRTEVDPKVFDSPNWAYKQAFKNGYRAALGVTKKLIDLDKQVIKEIK